MTRFDFQRLAVERLEDARALLTNQRYSCAYYLAGYAIECALKACIARKTQQDDFPPKDAPKYYIHDLAKLVSISGLEATFNAQAERDPTFRANWALVKDWDEGSRYESRGETEAREMLGAITDLQHGVLQWLKQNW